jgi:putative toxin-antitoxin system antitoxin component (TIGR02293 family)
MAEKLSMTKRQLSDSSGLKKHKPSRQFVPHYDGATGKRLGVVVAEPKTVDRPFGSFKEVKAGIAAIRLREIEGNSLQRADIRMIIPDRTLERRIADGAMLRVDEADGIARLLRVVYAARRVFGDDALADEWLRAGNPELGDIPIHMARTDLGGREVEAVLGRIEHGIFG